MAYRYHSIPSCIGGIRLRDCQNHSKIQDGVLFSDRRVERRCESQRTLEN